MEYVWPQPTDESLAAIYAGAYFFRNNTDEERARHHELKGATAGLYLDILQKAHPVSRGIRLLEIGCGTGDFLIEAASRGFRVTGVEISPTSSETSARRLPSGNVICGTLESADFLPNTFDVVASSDVIEHVRDPMAFLREVYRVLIAGGTLLLITPSLDSWSRKFLGRWWMEYKTEHLFYFSRRALREALRRTGFEELRIIPNEKVLSLDYVAAHFTHFPVPVLTPIVTGLAKVLPGPITHRPVKIVASGMTAVVRKPAVSAEAVELRPA